MKPFSKKIAVICNYRLMENRVGGMDYFFWMFDQKCKSNNIEVDWFFPNHLTFGNYSKLTIFAAGNLPTEQYFLDHLRRDAPQYSHIITHFVELCIPFFRKIKHYAAAKIIAVDHNPRSLHGYTFKKKLEKKVKGFLYSKSIDQFVGVSEYCRRALIKEFGPQIKKKTIVVFNGLDLDKFQKKTIFENGNNFIVASHLRKEKGIQDLILAVKNCVAVSKIPFTVTIFGEGYYEKELKQMVDDFRLNDYIFFKGSVANLHELYHLYDYLVHPTHGETYCFTVVESWICNLPVITTADQGNVLGLVKNGINGFLFDVGDIESLRTILLHIITKTTSIGNVSNTHAAVDFSLETMVNNYYNLIKT